MMTPFGSSGLMTDAGVLVRCNFDGPDASAVLLSSKSAYISKGNGLRILARLFRHVGCCRMGNNVIRQNLIDFGIERFTQSYTRGIWRSTYLFSSLKLNPHR
jgi:hypothetical protein